MKTGLETPMVRSFPRTSLNSNQRDSMFNLLGHHFDGVSRDQFEKDLAEKSHVILLERDGRVVGFSTLLVYESRPRGQVLTVIYSGDTIVSPEARSSPHLSRAWIATVKELRTQYTKGPMYWLLLTSGFRTYRFLPVFWLEFYPRYDREMPPDVRFLRDYLARERFGAAFNPESGLVRFAQPQRLRGADALLPLGRTADPHIAYFISSNPGYEKGDELVCLTELSDSNLTTAGWRMVLNSSQ